MTLLSLASNEETIKQNVSWLLGFRMTSALISALYYHSVGCKTVSLKAKGSSGNAGNDNNGSE